MTDGSRASPHGEHDIYASAADRADKIRGCIALFNDTFSLGSVSLHLPVLYVEVELVKPKGLGERVAVVRSSAGVRLVVSTPFSANARAIPGSDLHLVAPSAATSAVRMMAP